MASITRPRIYVLVFVALLGLTAVTVRLSFVDLGEWHSAVGLAIAVAKALLIVLFFMHVLHGTKLIWVIAISGLFWLGLLMTLTPGRLHDPSFVVGLLNSPRRSITRHLAAIQPGPVRQDADCMLRRTRLEYRAGRVRR